jgi:8-oxo-dGTP pyrophosphatase MutT (NUDIX family)
MNQLHRLQLEILKKLVFAPNLRYSDLKPQDIIENNQLDFHLNRLIEMGFVKKDEHKYSLTDAGKEYTTRLDTDDVTIIKQAKLSAWIGCIRTIGDKREFLIYTRLKHPFYGCQGFGGGRIKFGEKIIEAAKREFKEETGLIGEPIIVKVIHYRVFDKKTNQLLEDKLMFLNKIENPKGKLISTNEEGKYEWVKEENLYKYVTNHFENMDAFRAQVDAIRNFNSNVSIEEIDHWSSKF